MMELANHLVIILLSWQQFNHIFIENTVVCSTVQFLFRAHCLHGDTTCEVTHEQIITERPTSVLLNNMIPYTQLISILCRNWVFVEGSASFCLEFRKKKTFKKANKGDLKRILTWVVIFLFILLLLVNKCLNHTHNMLTLHTY